jgi:hypothetical protein
MKIMRSRLILPLVIILSLAAVQASAQFSVNTTNADQPAVRVNLKPKAPTLVDIENQAKARALRKLKWKNHNTVETGITITGHLTQFNKSWVNNNQNSFWMQINTYYYYTYSKSRLTYNFRFDGKYGLTLVDKDWFKTQDDFSLYNLVSWKIKEDGWGRNWSYSFETSFASQFAEGFKSRTEHQIWSNFMAPATFKAGLGIVYRSPNNKLPFQITLNPISQSALFVIDDRLDPNRRGQLGIPISWVDGQPVFKNYKVEGGSSVRIWFDRTFTLSKKKNLTMRYRSDLNSFYGWITDVSKRRLEDVSLHLKPTLNWSNTININPFKFLTIEFIHTTIYDKSQVDKVQMKYFLNVGLTFRYKNK